MKKILLIISILVSILGFYLSWYGNRKFMPDKIPENALIFEEPKALAGKVKILVDDHGDIYATSDGKCYFQKYDKDGNFLYGISIPTNGGSYDSYFMNDALYIIVVRGNMGYEICGKEIKKLGEKEATGNLDGFQYKVVRGNESYISKKPHTIEIENSFTQENRMVQLQNTPLCESPIEAWLIGAMGVALNWLAVLGIGYSIKDMFKKKETGTISHMP